MARRWLISAIQFSVVILSCVLSFSIRLFSNRQSEPMIHEFDPQFNWRCTQYIHDHGLYEFLGWFDNISWYPQGRPVGETSYPGLMMTVAITKWTLQKFHVVIDLLDISIFMGPCIAVTTTLVAFLYGRLLEDSTLGVTFAGIIAFVPGLISRSEAGAYDYECVAIFILIACVYTFSLALKTGSILHCVLAGFVYGYMTLTWGGYIFVSNCVPLFVAVLVAIGRYSWRLHIVYSIWVVVGSLLSASIPFIGNKIVMKPEHFAMLGVFVVIQIWGLFSYLKHILSPASFSTIVVSAILFFPLVLFGVITVGVSTGLLSGFSGRLMQMFDPSYASKNIPIIASVAEHQPSGWGMYFVDCGFFLLLFPLGCYFVLRNRPTADNETLYLLLIYGLSTMYFASIMVRLVLVFTPPVAFLGGLALRRLAAAALKSRKTLGTVIIWALLSLCICSVAHSVWFSCLSYSGNHIRFMVSTPDGGEESDDYREGYRWLWENTHPDSRVMSWWDYGYQITALSGRGCHADGNTNNFTHIGIVGMTMSSSETVSWKLARMMEADYLLVIFGGTTGYDGDDINKFLWMPKIANQTFTNISGDMYIGQSLVGPGMTSHMSQSMMFKMCYHKFSQFIYHPQMPQGVDIMRRVQIPHLKYTLTHFQEAFTTKHWIVRIFRVMPDPLWNRVY
jgi:dolichyl-diphosphooligosaccharide--protein glycosyltransferase